MDVNDTELAAHIRHLLYDYVHCHLTTDYIEFTQLAVSELFPTSLVPTQDPTALTLPIDPFSTLSTLLHLQQLTLFDEKLTTTQDARLLLKHTISSAKGTPKSERLTWQNSSHATVVDDEFYNADPILTRRAIRETPNLGQNMSKTAQGYYQYKFPKVDAKTYREFILSSAAGLALVDAPPMQEPKVKVDQVLDATFRILAADHTKVRNLLKSVSVAPRPQPQNDAAKNYNYRHVYLPSSFHKDSPIRIPTPTPDSPPLVPIFARNPPPVRESRTPKRKRNAGDSRTTDENVPKRLRNPTSMTDLPDYLGVPKVEGPSKYLLSDDEPNTLYKENMVVVDGWETYATSSPSIISTADEDADEQVDQLLGLFPSSPDTEVSCNMNLTRDIEDSKLEVIEIPRTRCIGGKANVEMTVERAIGHGRIGLGAFLTPLLAQPSSRTPDTTSTRHPFLDANLKPRPIECILADHTSTKKSKQPLARAQESDSMCGQATFGSAFSTLDDRGIAHAENEDDEIRNLYLPEVKKKSIGGLSHSSAMIDPNDFIRDEKLFDEKDDEIAGKAKDEGPELRLISIPVLPAPNAVVHARAGLVRNLAQYVVGANGQTSAENKPRDHLADRLSPPQFLRKAKGTAALRVSLSWVPFTLASAMPGHARVVGADKLFDADVEGDGAETGVGDVNGLLKRAFAFDMDWDEGELVGPINASDEGADERRWRKCRDGQDGAGKAEDGCFSPEIAKCEIILTRAERRGLLERNGGYMDNVAEEKSDEEIGESAMDDGEPQTEENVEEERAHDIVGRPAKRPRLEEFDDSGIGMMTLDRGVTLATEHGFGSTILDDTTDVSENSRNDDGMLQFADSQQDYDLYNDDLEKASVGMVPWTLTLPDAVSIHDAPPRGELVTSNASVALEGPRFDDGFCDYLADQELDYDDSGGSFEPLSLSYDSQAYRVLSVQPSQARGYSPTWNSQGSPHETITHHPNLQDMADLDQKIRDAQDQPETRRALGEIDIAGRDRHTAGMQDLNHSSDSDQRTISSTLPLVSLDLDLMTHSLGIESFTQLRAKPIKLRPIIKPALSRSSSLKSIDNDRATALPAQQDSGSQAPRITPQSLYDRKTLCPPSPLVFPTHWHKYMASLDVLQKQVLIRSFRDKECLVELIERENLGGVDLIVDPQTAVVFAPLLSLPAQHKTLLTRLSAQTWRYTCLLLIFEAYPSSRSFKDPSRSKRGASGGEVELYAYTPPIVKALKKLRRDLDIAEACGTKASACEVWYAFADTVAEAAAYARSFGDSAESRDQTRGTLWGGREWLDLDMAEEEELLSSFGGMNRLSASLVLCQATFQEFIDLKVEERLEFFGPFVGFEAMHVFNVDIERRLRTIESSEGDIVIDSSLQ